MPVYSSHLASYEDLRIGHRIREERQRRSLTLKALADRVGISSARLSEIENGHHVLDLQQALAIAQALEVPPAFFLPPDAPRPFQISRDAEVRGRAPHRMAGDRAARSGDPHVQFWPLADAFVGRHVEPALGRIMPGAGEQRLWSHHHEEEFLFVLKGTVDFVIQTPEGTAREELHAGDALYFRSDLPHSLRSRTGAPAESLHVFCSPSGLPSTGFDLFLTDLPNDGHRGLTELAGEKLKLLREMHGWPERHVANVTGIRERRLRQIERGERPIPLDVMLKLARVYGKPLREFIGQPTDGPSYALQRADQTAAVPSRKRRTPVERPNAPPSKTCQPLAGSYPSRSMYPYLLRLLNVALDTLTLHEHHGQEFIYVLEGELELTTFVGDREVKEMLRPGDSCYLDSSVPHLLRGQTRSPFSKTMAEVVDVFWCPLGEAYLFGD